MFIRKIVVGEISEDFAGLPVGLIIHPQPPLFLHGAPLVVEICLSDSQGPHAVRFQEKSHVQLVCRTRS